MSKKVKTPFPQSKKYKSPDGTIRIVWNNKLHSWDEPALLPEGNYRAREYYLYGIQHTEEDWKLAKRDLKGVPFYKDPRFNVRN